MKTAIITMILATMALIININIALAGEIGLDINFHAPTTMTDRAAVVNDIPEIKVSYTFDRGARLWASYRENENWYHGRRTFKVSMPAIGAGYRFIDNDRYSFCVDAGAYFPKFDNLHGYVEGLYTLARNTVTWVDNMPGFVNYEAKANWGLGASIGAQVKITKSLHANIGLEYLSYSWSYKMDNGKKYKQEAGASHWWFSERQAELSMFAGLGYQF